MSRFFRPKLEQIEIEDKYKNVVEGVLTKDIASSSEAYGYEKVFTLNNTRYFVEFTHSTASGNNELSLHFGLTDVDGNPVTNAGLSTFGKIVDEMSDMYEEILKQQPVDRILISASSDGFSKDELSRAKEIISQDPSKLQGLELEGYSHGGKKFSVEFRDGIATVKTVGKLGISFTDKIKITSSVFNDIRHVAKVDLTDFLPDILNYVKGVFIEDKKQTQRLKLYQFYLHKRYPQFTFNSKEVVQENGNKELMFEKDEHGSPYLLVTTHNNKKENTLGE